MFDYAVAMTLSATAPAHRRLDPDARERLAALAPRLDTGPLAGERVVAVHPALAGVLPQGLPRGSTVRSTGQAAVSGAFLLAAAASQAGAWIGVAGLPALGIQACAEAGVVLDRVVAVRDRAGRRDAGSRTGASSGSDVSGFTDDTWGQVLGALIDGFDVVVFGAADRVRAGTARRVQSRLAHRGVVLLIVGATGSFSCDIEVDTRATWEGLEEGHGHLRARRVDVSVDGRRIRRTQRDSLWFPDAQGQVQRVADVPADGVPATVVPLSLRQTG